MAFHSSLDVLLQVRRGAERQRELLLQAADRQLSALRHVLDTIKSQIEADSRRELLQMQSGLSAAELHFDGLCRSLLQARGQAVEIELAKAQASRELRAQAFRQARQQRQILETLREQQQQSFRQQTARRDQRRLDDLFLLRRAYLSRG
jgi:flagellar export protein FliJ